MKFSGKVANETLNNWLNFGGDLGHRLDTGIVFRIRHYWEIWKVVNGHESAAHIGNTCLGGGMHGPSAFSFITARRNARIASAVLATAIPSVCLSVCLSVRPSVTRRYCVKTTARSTVQFTPLDSKMCLVL